MLRSIRCSCPSITSSCCFQLELARGYLTQRRRQEQEEWWAVDGEIFPAEEFDAKRVLEPSPNMQVSNKKRRKDRMKDLALSRLKFRSEDQESYWASYIRRYQIMRDEWEKLVWDPKPVPQPKMRNPTYVKQDAEKYVWRDPRRDAYADRMTMPFTPSKFDKKAASRLQGMDRYPFMAQRDTGAHSNRYETLNQPNINRGPTQDLWRPESPYHTHRNMGYDNDKFGGSYKTYGGGGGDHEAGHTLRGGNYSQRDRVIPQNEKGSRSAYQPYRSRIQYEDNDEKRDGRNSIHEKSRDVRSNHRSIGSSEDDDEVANMSYKNKVKYGDTKNMSWFEDVSEEEDDDHHHPEQSTHKVRS